MRGVMVNALVTLLALLLSMGASRGEKNWVSYKDGTIEWLCQKIEGTETCKIKPEPARKELRIKGKVKIPSEVTIDGKTLKVVTVAKNAFSGCEKLSEVFIPEGVDTIEERAFYSCAELSTLQLPQCLKVIGEQSFSRCGKLESVNIPVNVESIGYDAFQYCSKLEKFEVAAENKHLSAVDGVLFNKDKTALLRYIIGPGGDSYTIPTTVKSIGARAFIMGEGRLKTVNISANVESIGYDAFQDCNELEKFEVAAGNGHFSEAGGVLFNKDKTALLCYPRGLSADSYDIPEKVKSIGACAFYGNGKLQTVNIPAGVTAIGKHAFEECSVLERVVVPKGVSTIEPNTFYFCDNLKSVELPERLKTIGEEAFSTCESLEIVVLPEGLTSIGKSAFAFSPKFSEVTIPTSVTEIGEGAFSGTPLTSVVIPAGVKKLNGTFSGCIFLEKVTLPEGLEVLEGTFSACEKLTEITIPASVISIEDWTFYGSISLNRVYYLAEADAAVTENAFDGIADPATLFVRKGEKVKIEGNGKAWKAKFKVIEERNVVTFDADGGLPTPAAQWLKDDNKGAEKPAKDPVKEGFRFKGWTLLISGEDYHFDTKVEGNIALKAKYIAEYTLTITAGTNGSVKVIRDNAQGDALTDGAKLKERNKLFIVATPAAGYELETLTVNGAAHANSSVFTVGKANVEVKATFKAKSGATPPAVAEYTLTITAGANGSVKVTRDNAQGEELTSGAKLHEGDKLFIAATPAAGYELEALTVNGKDHANSSVFTVGKANVAVAATFKAQGGATPPSAVESVLLAAARVVQNPIANALVLEGVSTAERIEVYSLAGVRTYACAPRGEDRMEIATGSWASGTYVVRIIAADGEKAIRIVKR